jgi:uncharacterized protein (TIGR03437 family)
MNAASNISATLPNGPLAPGSIFIVKGTGLGPTTLAIAPNPFQSTTLNGTSVSVTIAGTKVDALMYYTSDKQIAALLPSNTPTGTGTITVTYNGASSPATAIRGVAANSLGIFTISSTGGGVGIITFADYSLVSPFKATNCGGPNTTCGAANRGETLILWGTGLGAVNGSDASGAGLGQNMPDIPLQLWIGNVRAQVLYQGRSGCCIGEDQIVFTIPNDAPTGCAVPVIARINGQVSNQVTMSIAPSGRTCVPADVPGVSAQALVPPFIFGNVELKHFRNDNGVGFNDQASIFFAKVPSVAPLYAPFVGAIVGEHVPGTCNVMNGNEPDAGAILFQNASVLDGGSSFVVKGPNATLTVRGGTGDNAPLGTNGSFIVPGDYTITGPGGKDVGSFTSSITLPRFATLTTPASGNITVNRNQGMTVNWTPNGASGTVEMTLQARDSFNVSTVAVVCTVPASLGTFTIPAYATLALPSTNNAFFSFDPGGQGPAASSTFTASGATIGFTQIFVDGAGYGGITLN